MRGETAEVRLSGANARRVIFGAMNLVTGMRLLLPPPKGRSVECLRDLDSSSIILVDDNH